MVDSEKVLLSIIEIATCPVCYTRLSVSPTLCVNGHAVCSDCDNNLSQILDKLPSVCSLKGCSHLTMDLDNHEKWCGYRPINCERCSWSGQAKELKTHVTENHQLASTNTDRTSLLLQDNINRSYARVQFDQVFWEKTMSNSKDKTFSIQLFWVPNGEIEEDVFHMKVEFTSKEKSYVANTRIKFIPKDSSETENCLVFHTDILKHFANCNIVTYKLYLTKD